MVVLPVDIHATFSHTLLFEELVSNRPSEKYFHYIPTVSIHTMLCVSTALHTFCLGSVSTCYQRANLAIRRESVYLSTHPAACTEHADESGSGWIHAGE